MSYVDRDNRREKSLSGIGSVLLVTGIGYALVTGLAVKIIHIPIPDLVVHNYSEPAPEPPPPPRILKRAVKAQPHMTTIVPPLPPIPIVPLQTAKVPSLPTPTFPDSTKLLGNEPAKGDETASQAVAAMPKGAPGDWVTPEDYPSAALREGTQGRTGFRLEVGVNGRVTDCAITQSSGSDDLDRTACRLLRSRAHFTPAHDASGSPIASSYASAVLWKLPRD